jgi:aerobic-type carbon monoxide dehydrogenase small subunit (CoxS/CutS family)
MADRRVGSVDRGEPFHILVNGRSIAAYRGETVAGVLLAAGIRSFRRTTETGAERGQFCGMGVCYDCLIDYDDQFSVRACMTPAVPDMDVTVPEQLDEDER